MFYFLAMFTLVFAAVTATVPSTMTTGVAALFLTLGVFWSFTNAVG